MKHKLIHIALFFIIISCFTLHAAHLSQGSKEITREDWGEHDGKPVYLYNITNENGFSVSITNYGGNIVSILAADKNGRVADVAPGFDNLQDYIEKGSPNGAIIGRYANRIAEGEFSLAGKTHQLEVNSPPNHLHGGSGGFAKQVWKSEEFENIQGIGIILNYTSEDGEASYPGKLDVQVTYTITEDNEIMMEYEATTDKTTIVNLTNHAYFNLAGHDAGDILDHQVMINANQITPVNQHLIPTGEFMEVEETPFDFRDYHAIGERIDADHQQLKYGNGYDHNYVLRGNQGSLRTAARAYDPQTGRMLVVYTTEPGLQFYTGNFLNGVEGKNGATYGMRAGFCMEAQHYPDSPNHDNFPSVTLQPDETYRQTTIYRFTIFRE